MANTFDHLKSALADRYAIEEELGAGGMATVYLAEDLKHERKVALKVSKPELAAVVGADLHPDGDRLVVPQNVGAGTAREGAAPEPERFQVVVNWFEELKERVGN